MTVKELIEELKKFPQDTEIVMDGECGYINPNYIYIYEHPVLSFNPYIEREKPLIVISSK